MCGIAGIYNFRDRRPVDRNLLEAMTERMCHRGPDDRGFLVDGSLGLGMRRLSIIDLEGGGQPIGNESGSVQVVCNGEIYNYRSLRRQLQESGHRFRTHADTEVIVHGYEEYGDEVLQRLNGMFAIALWDAPRRRLLLCRDRVGIKPLYYAETSSGLVFGSELKAVILAPAVATDLDPAAIEQYFVWEFIPAPRTPFATVKKLPPATRLIIEAGGVRSSAYWRLEPGPEIADLREAKEGLRSQLRRSVRLRLEADVSVGAFLSGGIDSASVVSTLAELGKAPIHTFSIGFGEDDFNEANEARIVASYFGTEHTEEVLRPRCQELIEEVSAFMDEPFADNSILPTYLVSRLARGHVKVVLSGDGGDELFGGYDRYKAARLGAWLGKLPEGLRGALFSWSEAGDGGRPSKHGSWGDRARRLSRAMALPTELEHARWMVRGFHALQGDLLLGSREGAGHTYWMEPWTRAFQGSPFLGGLHRQFDVDVRTYLVDDILFKLDRASMATSLEARVPFLDHELVEYAFRIPARWKLRGLRGKWILRRTQRGRVPWRTVRRRKSGFSIPVAAWLRGELHEMARDLLAPKRLTRQGLFHAAAVEALMREHQAGIADNSRALWSLIMFQLWWDRVAGSRRVDEDPVELLSVTNPG